VSTAWYIVDPAGWHIVVRLTSLVEEVTGETYNFTLVNYYSSGTDSISYHSDSESFLGPNPCIASLSLGAPRDFHLRHVDYKTNGVPPQKFVLHDGDMVVMRGKTQHRWQHAVPKRKHADGRINITFRKGVVRYATANYNQYNVGKGPMYRWEKGRMVEKVATGGLSGA
jgi:alkylated DNA repair dioxygenase AlkB